MRRLVKRGIPELLEREGARWAAELIEDPDSPTRKTRYRAREIKEALLEETSWKCVYCESKIGHNTPGDIEHKIPASKRPELRFDWLNLTTACTECNRRKNDYYEEGEEFLDPYVDDVESRLVHHGPIVAPRVGDVRAEITVRVLELGASRRVQLVLRKIERLEVLTDALHRIEREPNDVLRSLLRRRVTEMSEANAEYSAMVLTVCRAHGLQGE